MRNSNIKTALALLAPLTVCPSLALAEQTYHGGVCQPYLYTMSYANQLEAFYNTTPSNQQDPVMCPTPTDQSIGDPRWRIRVRDNSSTRGFDCGGLVYDANGNLLAFTAAGTTPAFVGSTTLSTTATTGFSSTYALALYCAMPNNQSAIYRITLD